MKNGTHSFNVSHLQNPNEPSEEWATADCFIASAQAAVQDAVAKQLREGLPVPVWHEGRVVDLRVLKSGVADDVDVVPAASTDTSPDPEEAGLVVSGVR
jgi:hypothetical protein